jgi:hypothetical protein
MNLLIDTQCPACAAVAIDVWVTDHDYPPCDACGTPVERLFQGTGTGHVIQDSIEGGVIIEHGLCHPDGSPQKFYSKSGLAAEAKRRGLVNRVSHKTGNDSDQAPHTTRWF